MHDLSVSVVVIQEVVIDVNEWKLNAKIDITWCNENSQKFGCILARMQALIQEKSHFIEKFIICKNINIESNFVTL